MTFVDYPGNVRLWQGTALGMLAGLADASVDAVVTDPPYNLAFMGRTWDTVGSPAAFAEWCETWAREVYRVLKPGGHLLAFGSPRTVHRLTCGVEDAGFEVRDGIVWAYAQGMPHGLAVDKAIDRAAGAEREIVGHAAAGQSSYHRVSRVEQGYRGRLTDVDPARIPLTIPASDDARRWQGWNTAIKPAQEPIVVARKPLAGPVASNVLEHGVGAYNVDACRIPAGQDYADKCASVVGLTSNRNGDAYGEWTGERTDSTHPAGRWPTNLVMSHAATRDGEDLCAAGCVEGCPVRELDEQSGHSRTPETVTRGAGGQHGAYSPRGAQRDVPSYADEGGGSRMFPVFRYEAKASSVERPRDDDGRGHATVKPVNLIRWLARLVTPPGGLVVDPFAGSGTLGEAARAEGFRALLAENDPDHWPLIAARMARPTRMGRTVLDLRRPIPQLDGQAAMFE